MNSNNCFVPSCIQDPNHFCFPLPKEQHSANIWMERCGIEQKYAAVAMVCEAHFHKAMVGHSVYPKRLKRGATPTFNLPPIRSYTIDSSDPQGNTYNVIHVEMPIDTTTGTERSNHVSNYMRKTSVNPLDDPLSQPNLSTDTSISNLSTKIEPRCNETKEIEDYTTQMNQDHVKLTGVILEPIAVATSSSNIEVRDNKISHGETLGLESTLNVTNAIQPDSNLTNTRTNYATRTIRELQHRIQFISKLQPDAFKMLAVKIYFNCSQGYKILHKTLHLPQVSALKSILDGCSISTDNTVFTSILQYKSQVMPVNQKLCILCLGTIDVRKKLYYDIKRDKLIGVCDINNTQKPGLACKILVLTMQGIQTDWKQPVGVAYIKTGTGDDLTEINQWINKNISNLMSIGFKVRALVCEADNLLTNIPPHHETYSKIIYIYDILSLIKLFFYTFLTHDYIFKGERAEMQHILDYVNKDSNIKPRLSPKLTEKAFKPASIQDVNITDIMEIISLRTAAAMTTYINLNALNPTAKSTVHLIVKMSTLLEVFYSNKCDNASREKHKQVLYDIIWFFKDFTVVDSVTKEEVAAGDTFVPKFQSTIKAIYMLYEDDIKCKDDTATDDALRLHKLSLENMRLFLDRIKKADNNGTELTCKKVYLAYMQSALLNVFRSTHDEKRKADLDMEANLNEIKKVVVCYKDKHKVNIPSDIKIKPSEYNKLRFKNKDTVVLIAGYLLKKCYDQHSDCDDMKNYIYIVLQDTSSICKTILKEIQESICVVPQESFIEFVEMMEIRFRSFMSKEVLDSENGFIDGLLKAIEPVTFSKPCSCFPILYAKKLYLRVRIYNMLKYNNSCLTAFPERYENLTVNSL